MTAAIFFAPDAYLLKDRQIMGRRMAGAAFLRAAVEGRGDEPVVAYTRDKANADLFIEAVNDIDPTAVAKWIPAGRHDLVAQLGTLYRADPVITIEARMRLRSGAARFSLCGVTHTLLSSGTLDGIAGYVCEPIMPWDALICTSAAGRDVVQSTLDDAQDYMAWRTGTTGPATLPQLPVIPLGIHSGDWTVSDDARCAARLQLSITDTEVVCLFAGRLSFAGKAHPFQMYEALRAVAETSDRPITLLLAGQFFNDLIKEDFLGAARRYCPTVRCVHVDGGDGDGYAAAFAASDIFLSLADNMQETFGITPIEAMAAGLPVVVSDWNGYRDTVRNGIDGFRIPSWAPGGGAGETIARAYELTGDYDSHSSLTSTTVSIDMAMLVARLELLVRDDETRRQMGAAGRARAVADYDWALIYRRYRELWDELGAIRNHVSAEAEMAARLAQAPTAHPAHADPFRRFATYPSHAITADTIVFTVPPAGEAGYEELVAQPMFSFWQARADLVGSIMASAAEPLTVELLARRVNRPVEALIPIIARLAKMNLMVFRR